MKELDAMQVELAGTNLIEASAGTGKTYTIATLYLRLLLERELDVGQILVVTFTNAATAELRDRIRRRIGEALEALTSEVDSHDSTLSQLCQRFGDEEMRRGAVARLRIALSDFDQAAISTIHSFCQKVLEEHAFESGAAFEVELVAEQGSLLAEVVDDFWAPRMNRSPESLVRYLVDGKEGPSNLIQLYRRAAASPEMAILPAEIDLLVGDDSDLDASLGDWNRALDRVRALWSEHRDEVLELLVRAIEEGHLKKTSYKLAPPFVEAYGGDLESLFAGPTPGFSSSHDRFRRMTPNELENCTKGDQPTPRHPFFDACGELWDSDQRLGSLLSARRIKLQLDAIHFIREETADRKAAAGTQYFDDLLLRLKNALAAPGGAHLAARIRGRMPVALIDEFQDTDDVQYAIARQIWHQARDEEDEADASSLPTSLFLIGDPKQAIYAFRGADVFAYLGAQRDAAGARHTLIRNWRSDPRLIAAVNALFENRPEPFGLEEIAFDAACPRPDAKDSFPETPALEILMMEAVGNPTGKSKPVISATRSKQEVPSRVAADISDLLQSGRVLAGHPLAPRDIAVLCRKKSQVQAICEALQSLGIPVAQMGDSSVFDSDEALHLERVLRAVASPADAGAIRLALATPLFGFDAQGLVGLVADSRGWEAWLERFRAWHESWQSDGFIQIFHRILREEDVHARLLSRVGGERRLTNFLHLGELLEQMASQRHLGASGLVEFLELLRTDEAARRQSGEDESQLRLESESDAVTVVTIHRSKGLEYPIVYCPYLWSDDTTLGAGRQYPRFHDPRNANRMTLDIGSEAKGEHLKIAKAEALAEGTRVLYVALTRAKHLCRIVWGRFNGFQNSAMAGLLHPNHSKVSALTPEKIQDEAEDLAARSGGDIGVRALPAAPGPIYRSSNPSQRLECRPATRRIRASWRHSSFSALVSAASHERRSVLDPAEEGLDYDAVKEEVLTTDSPESGAEVRLHQFPAGAAAGTMLHTLLENLDFRAPDREGLNLEIAELLTQNGFDAGWNADVREALLQILATRFASDPEAPRLADIDRKRRLDELEFLLPVRGGDRHTASSGDAPLPGFSVSDLADAFARHAVREDIRSYAETLRHLEFLPLSGYLKGFIDLVFEWRGRFYVVDYKSNHLGGMADDYRPEALIAPMTEHHYVLQYHLYQVALHRHLGSRLADYEYDRHVGGSWYLFLRGMAPQHPPGYGIYRDEPPRVLIESLSEILSKPDLARSA